MDAPCDASMGYYQVRTCKAGNPYYYFTVRNDYQLSQPPTDPVE